MLMGHHVGLAAEVIITNSSLGAAGDELSTGDKTSMASDAFAQRLVERRPHSDNYLSYVGELTEGTSGWTG